jgi:transcriptional regulator with XRE-family HTH domain
MGRLRQARESLGLSLTEAAKRLGMSVATLRGLEGDLFPPTPEDRARIAAMYPAQPEQLPLFGEGGSDE